MKPIRKVYLSGPIDCAPDYGVEWRKVLTGSLKSMGIRSYDPTLTADFNNPAIELARMNQDWRVLHEIFREIRNRDLAELAFCDTLIVRYDLDIPMAGTHEEISFAARGGKNVLMMCPQGVDKINNWYFGMIHPDFMFSSWPALLRFLEKNTVTAGT